MSFVHKNSPECTKSELDLFSVPPTQTSIVRGEWVEYQPIANIKEGNDIQFIVSGMADCLLDLSRSFLSLKVRVVTDAGENVKLGEGGDIPIAPTNLFMHSLFSQVDVALNNRTITPSNNTYNYVALIETLLNYGEDVKQSRLTGSLFYKDTAGAMDDMKNNTGIRKRSEKILDGQTIDLIGQVHCDIFKQDRLLLNRVNMTLKFIRAKDDFCLIGPLRGCKVIIEDAALHIRKETPSPAILLAQAKALERGTAKYPITRSLLKGYSYVKGVLNINQDNIFNGQLPTSMVICFVETEAFNGSYEKNPYNFKHCDTNFLAVYVDGQQYPHKPLTPNFEEGNYINTYNTLFQMCPSITGNNIDRDDFKGGYTFFAFDLTPDGCSTAYHYNTMRSGNVRVEVHFAKPLPSTTNMLVYATFQNIIEIDKQQNVIFDFNH